MENMRFLLLYVTLAVCLGVHGAKGDIYFTLQGASSDTYGEFIKQVRQQLTFNTKRVYDIPVLKQTALVPLRFILIHLSNSSSANIVATVVNSGITLAIDVVNASIVGYRTGSKSYFFQDAPQIASKLLFIDTIRNTLPYTANYIDVESAAKTTRANIPLGPSPFVDAISNLVNYDANSAPQSFLVIMQMISEAAKFKFIEQNVRNSIRDGSKFTPGPTMLSLEDNWSNLSEQIQIALTLEGLFPRAIEIHNVNGKSIPVDNVQSPIVSEIALLLYRCAAGDTGNNIPVFIKGILRILGILGYDKSCQVLTNRTTLISGRDGLCADVSDVKDNNNNYVISYPCHFGKNQQWTFQDDGTIRSIGKCMMASGYNPGNDVVIYNCTDSQVQDATKWVLSPDGTIINHRSGLVLTARFAAAKTKLTLETNTFSASQGWRAGDYVNPIMSSIVGLNDMCLQANSDNSRVWLEECVSGKKDQIWALYSDGSIRINGDKSLCVTSDCNNSLDLIVIRKCEGSSNQRWLFKADGSILNPNSGLVMEVRQSNVDLQQIILYRSTGSANQKWVLLF